MEQPPPPGPADTFGATDSFGPTDPLPSPSFGSSFFDSIRRTHIARVDERWFGGVAGAYARRMNIDPLIVRAVFIGLTVFGGLGLIAYGISWMLLPEESDGRIHLQEALTGRFDGALALATAFVLVGLLAPAYYGPGRLMSAGTNLFVVAAPIFGILIGALVLGGIVVLSALLFRRIVNRPRRNASARDTRANPQSPAHHPEPAPSTWAHNSAPVPDTVPLAEGSPATDSPQQDSDVDPMTGQPVTGHPMTGRTMPGHPAPEQSTLDETTPLHVPVSTPAWSSATATAPPVFSAGQHTPPGAAPKFTRRSPSPGRRAVSLAVAVVFLTCAAVLATWQLDLTGFITYPPVAMAGATILGLGLILTVLGLIGRRGGFVSFLAIMGLIAGGVTTTLTYDAYTSGAMRWDGGTSESQVWRFTPTSLSQLENFSWEPTHGYHLALNFSEIPADEIAATGGEFNLNVPDGGVNIDVVTGVSQPVDVHVTGDFSDVYSWGPGHTTYERATRNGDFYSLAVGGALTRESGQTVQNTLQIRIHAPHSTVSIDSWS